jgi:hypothetical protein
MSIRMGSRSCAPTQTITDRSAIHQVLPALGTTSGRRRGPELSAPPIVARGSESGTLRTFVVGVRLQPPPVPVGGSATGIPTTVGTDSSSSRTTLVVTHDPGIVKHADVRLVMQAGRVERTEGFSRASRTEDDLMEGANPVR